MNMISFFMVAPLNGVWHEFMGWIQQETPSAGHSRRQWKHLGIVVHDRCPLCRFKHPYNINELSAGIGPAGIAA
jgi:hypothetical protein